MSFLLYKPVGFTPLQALYLVKKQFPQYAHSRLGAAGRLDPMAEGLLLVMVDEENKNQATYLNLDKTYEVELVLGITTDSYDLLGFPALHSFDVPPADEIGSTIHTLQGKILQAYPPYSAVRVKGKPLYWWTRQQRLTEINIPAKLRNIHSIDLLGCDSVSSHQLMEAIQRRIGLVSGDFRQENICDSWKQLLSSPDLPAFPRIRMSVQCSSGTYVRSLVNSIGQSLGTGATTTQIIRTKIGDYSIDGAIRLKIPT